MGSKHWAGAQENGAPFSLCHRLPELQRASHLVSLAFLSPEYTGVATGLPHLYRWQGTEIRGKAFSADETPTARVLHSFLSSLFSVQEEEGSKASGWVTAASRIRDEEPTLVCFGASLILCACKGE